MLIICYLNVFRLSSSTIIKTIIPGRISRTSSNHPKMEFRITTFSNSSWKLLFRKESNVQEVFIFMLYFKFLSMIVNHRLTYASRYFYAVLHQHLVNMNYINICKMFLEIDALVRTYSNIFVYLIILNVLQLLHTPRNKEIIKLN
jgi:hypothetical protein